MGLDIAVLVNPTYLGAVPDDDYVLDEMYDKGYTCVYAGRHFETHLDGYPEGFYDGESYHAFHMTYSGYNRFRAVLCEFGLGVEPAHVWANLDEYADCALFPLIHFSDCEGTIGPQTSGIIEAGLDSLAADSRFENYLREHSYHYPEAFKNLRGAFHDAANSNGFVIYG